MGTGGVAPRLRSGALELLCHQIREVRAHKTCSGEHLTTGHQGYSQQLCKSGKGTPSSAPGAPQALTHMQVALDMHRIQENKGSRVEGADGEVPGRLGACWTGRMRASD